MCQTKSAIKILTLLRNLFFKLHLLSFLTFGKEEKEKEAKSKKKKKKGTTLVQRNYKNDKTMHQGARTDLAYQHGGSSLIHILLLVIKL